VINPSPFTGKELEVMMIGSTVYWIVNNWIRSGEVVAMRPSEHKTQIVVDDGTCFRTMDSTNEWETWHETPMDAYRAAVDAIAKKQLECSKAMSGLHDDLKRLMEDAEKKDSGLQ